MLSSFGGDKHEFCLIVINYKHVRSCPNLDIIKNMTAWSEIAQIFDQFLPANYILDNYS